MEPCEEKIIEKCRICDVSVNDGDFVPLFTISNRIIERTYSGELFDELIQLPSTEDTNYPYICNGCDLQMKLFKRLKDKAWKRLNARDDNTSESIIEISEITETEKDDSFLDANNLIYAPENENRGSNIDLSSQLENTLAENQSNNAAQSENTENNNFLFVYNMKGQSLQSVNIDDLIELENCEEKEKGNDCEPEDQNFLIETIKCIENTTEEPHITETENVDVQNVSTNDVFYGIEKSIESHTKSTGSECKECSLIFPSIRSFKLHRQEQHGRKHLCNICQKLFKTAENLEGHMRKHSGLAPYQCEACNKTFNQKVHYQYHMKRHKNERDFICNLCDKSYLTKSDLTLHIKRTHEGERNFICSFKNCGKRFYFEQHLKYHTYVHSGKRNFECELCQQKFVAPNALALHKRTIHSTGIRFECSQCGKTFRRKHHLEIHYSVHESSNSHENYVLNRKANISKNLIVSQEVGVNEIDENSMQTIQDQSDDNDFLMDVIESCSETDIQNESDNYNYC